MTLHLPAELENGIKARVRCGEFVSEDDAIAEAVRLLLRRGTPDSPLPARPLSEAEFTRHLLEVGLMTGLPTPADPATERGFRPVPIQGEPISQTIIRERR